MEAIKLLANLGHPPLGRLIHYRALSTLFREIKIKPDPDCPLCGDNPTITEPFTDKKEMTELLEITTLELRKILTDGFEDILLDVREQDEYMMAHIEGSRTPAAFRLAQLCRQPSQGRKGRITSTAQPACGALGQEPGCFKMVSQTSLMSQAA